MPTQHWKQLARAIIRHALAEEEAAEIEDEAYEEGGPDAIAAYTPHAAAAAGADAWAHVPVAPGVADADAMLSSSMLSQVSTANSTSTVRQLFRRHGPAAAGIRNTQSTPAAPSTSRRRRFRVRA